MLESKMEEAIATCPELFIESGLTLVWKQVVINGRRPDLLFSYASSCQFLIEIQSGRLDVTCPQTSGKECLSTVLTQSC